MNKCILIVEDDDILRESLKDLIAVRDATAKVFLAANPVEALDHFHTNKDVMTHVVVDYFMPIENGTELCKMIKAQRKDLNVVIFTGNGDLTEEEVGEAADRIIYKPDSKLLINYLFS